MAAERRADLVADEHDDGGAEARAPERARAADDDRHEGHDRGPERRVGGRDALLVGGEQRPRQPRDRPGDAERRERVQPRRVAERPHAFLVAVDAAQREAERRARDHPQHAEADREDGQHEPVAQRRLRQRVAAGHDLDSGIPNRPFDPPVTSSALSASRKMISPTASVSIRKKIPRLRTVSQPVMAATAPAARTAAGSATTASALTSLATSPAV